MKYFEDFTICKVENWHECRLKGKFIKLFESDSGDNWVLSKFYYTFSLDEETTIFLGLHQEDQRIIGADRR
jgi:hypothetical protein